MLYLWPGKWIAWWSNHINLHLQIWCSLYWIIILILGRTGTAICSWLIANGQFEQAQVLLSSIGFFVFLFFWILYKHYFLEKWLLLNGGNLYFKLQFIIYNLLLLSLWVLFIFVITIITFYHCYCLELQPRSISGNISWKCLGFHPFTTIILELIDWSLVTILIVLAFSFL